MAARQAAAARQLYLCGGTEVIRDKTDWVIPENRRNLNFPVIKTFINEVFLKQRLLGHLFRTLRNRQLAEMPHPLLNTFLCEEQKVRQLEIVRASKYLFAIAPTVETGLNPFGLRRFLQEDLLYSDDQFLLNGTAVNTALLANGDEEIQRRFRQQIAAIITIEGKVSRFIIDQMESLDKYHEEYLFPLLFQPFDANLVLDKAVAARLQEYEDMMEENILQPFKAIVRRASNQDELNYLQLGMRQLFGSIISVFKDFQTLPAIRGSELAEVFLGRLVAYTAFLEKRREDVFVRMDDDEWVAACNRAKQVAVPILKTLPKKACRIIGICNGRRRRLPPKSARIRLFSTSCLKQTKKPPPSWPKSSRKSAKPPLPSTTSYTVSPTTNIRSRLSIWSLTKICRLLCLRVSTAMRCLRAKTALPGCRCPWVWRNPGRNLIWNALCASLAERFPTYKHTGRLKIVFRRPVCVCVITGKPFRRCVPGFRG
ncbi:hypothetical protein [Kingella potus]|uniref:hypothetical protein n=1 Tax=Kingella potus TaxID=265175 RepID=UPI001FD5294A|nr:hypothetical protein [Kingella potus]UOP00110.1 hypothetical protein LVJ84_09065 [Kingella potus]